MQFFAALFIFFSFSIGYSQSLKKVAALPSLLKESSGLVSYTDTSFLTINDSGGEAIVYEISVSGKITSKTTFKNAQNIDWEEITIDSSGFVYIGDIGNNLNQRNNLTIYKFPASYVGNRDVSCEEIHFYYPEQQSFPPDKNDLHYDAEAFLVWGDEIIIFTKCRTVPFTGQTRIYAVPNLPGRHDAVWINSLVIGTKSWISHAVTGVCRFNNGIALLTYSDWYEIKQFDPRSSFWKNGNVTKNRLPFYRQREAITQGIDGKLYITDEKHPLLGGGNLYKWIGKDEK